MLGVAIVVAVVMKVAGGEGGWRWLGVLLWDIVISTAHKY